MALHVVNEAKRCLNCKKPMCREGCPIHTPIPQMIETFLKGDIDEAGRMLFENNPLSMVCSLVCNHENQCEGHCVLNRKGAPVHISSIENYISENYFAKLRSKPAAPNGMSAAIIGSGPAGITIALILADKGYEVTIFESRDRIGGVLRYGIPDFRLPKALLDHYRDELRARGVHIRPNTTIGGALGIDDLFRDGYGAIFIGTGVWRPKKLGIRGESLGHVHFAIDYLTNPDSYQLGDSVIVIGAGNSAMDAARTAMRHGARSVSCYYRRDETSASEREMDYARVEGVRFVPRHSPVEITRDGVIFEELVPDEQGRWTPVAGSAKLHPADSVIVSISQGPKDKIVSTTTGIKVDGKGLVITDDCGRTTREGIFASGDVVNGARTVVEAVCYSKRVAQAMDAYMRSQREEQQG